MVQPTVSYTRNIQEPSEGALKPMTDGESDEDSRFLRLAHEALVATTADSKLVVDPTIQSLLARLQYILSPHGNPIKRSENINSDDHGQLMIQNFYKGFPDLSNDIFSKDNDPPQPQQEDKSEAWDYLIDRAGKNIDPGGDQMLDTGDSRPRKFPCLNCSMLFRRSSDLKRHERQHYVTPANICNQCGKGFARKDALKRHVGTLTCKRNADRGLYRSNLSLVKREQ